MEKIRKVLQEAGVKEEKIQEVFKNLGLTKVGRVLGGDYFYINTCGGIQLADDSFTYEDSYRYVGGNYYLTEQEAKNALDAQLGKESLIRGIKDSSDEIDWADTSQDKYFLHYSHNEKTINISSRCALQFQEVTQTTNCDYLEELIKTHENEIKKYLFDIDIRELA